MIIYHLSNASEYLIQEEIIDTIALKSLIFPIDLTFMVVLDDYKIRFRYISREVLDSPHI